MINLTVCKKSLKTTNKYRRKKGKTMGIHKRKREFQEQNNIYGQYLVQEEKDIERTVKSLKRTFV